MADDWAAIAKEFGGSPVGAPTPTLTTPAAVNNNPGNLRVPGKPEFQKFNSPEEGYQGLIKDIESKQSGKTQTGLHGGSTLYDLTNAYAPKNDGNDPTLYAQNIAKQLGVAPETTIGQLKSSYLANAIAHQEDGPYWKSIESKVSGGGGDEWAKIAGEFGGKPVATAQSKPPTMTPTREANKALGNTGLTVSRPQQAIIPEGLQSNPDRSYENIVTPAVGLARKVMGGAFNDVGEGVAAMSDPSLDRKAHGLHQAASGAARMAIPAMIPGAIATPISTGLAIGAGLGVQQGVTAGAQKLGVPPGYSELAGDVAGLSTGTLTGPVSRGVANVAGKLGERDVQSGLMDMIPYWGSKLNNLRDLVSPPPAPPQPYQRVPINPNILRQANRYGGPGPSEAGNTPGQTIPRRGPPPLAPEVAEATQAPVPFKPNPRIAAKTRFGGPGPSEAGNTPGTTIPRRGPPPVPDVVEPAPAVDETIPHEPYKPNPNIKRLTRYGGNSQSTPQSYQAGRAGKGPVYQKPPAEEAADTNSTEVASPPAEVPQPATVADHPNAPVRAKQSIQRVKQQLKEAVTGQKGAGVAKIESTDTGAGARANQIAAGYNKYLSKLTGGGKITAEQVYSLKPAEIDQFEAQIAAAKAGELDIPKFSKGGVVAPIPKRSKPGRISSRGNWYGPPGSTPYQVGRHG